MKHYFIQNPNSGKNQKIDVIKECVIPAAEKAGIDYEIYDTKCKGDATNFVNDVKSRDGSEAKRRRRQGRTSASMRSAATVPCTKS